MHYSKAGFVMIGKDRTACRIIEHIFSQEGVNSIWNSAYFVWEDEFVGNVRDNKRARMSREPNFATTGAFAQQMFSLITDDSGEHYYLIQLLYESLRRKNLKQR